VEVFNGQELLARLDPAQLLQALALGAVAVAARVVADLLVTTTLTLINMTAEGRRAAALDSPHDLALLERQGLPGAIAGSELAKDVSQLQGRASRCSSTAV